VADTGMVSERGMKGIQGDIDMNNGKRFISISELKRGVPLSSNIVKNLTTNEPMVAKRLYCDQYLSKPSAIFFLSTNNKPKIPDTDEGTWRRLVFIPFTYIFDASVERNNTYKKASSPFH
jgi:phage/plasmid-associated DNA primase